MSVPRIFKLLNFHSRNFWILAATFLLLLVLPLTVFLAKEARDPASKAESNNFSIVSLQMVGKEIGSGSLNNTPNVDICGTDLGHMFDWNGKVYLAFGDTFGCPLNQFSQPNWRKNSMAVTTDTNPSDGITFDYWILGDNGKAKELFTVDPGAITAIPTYGISVGSTGYLFYMQVTNWTPWTCNYSSIAKSTDGGQNWTRLAGIKWNSGNFNQVAIYRKEGYLYIFGIPCGRAGGVKLMRVLESQVENKVNYQYLTGFSGNNPIWTTNSESAAIQLVPPAVGELSVRWNDYLERYIMMYLHDDPPGQGRGIEIRSATNLWGPWSDPLFVTSGSTYPCLYAPFMKEGFEEDNGKTIYFRMSRLCLPTWDPYSTYWMKMTFEKVTGGTPNKDATSPPPIASDPPVGGSSMDSSNNTVGVVGNSEGSSEKPLAQSDISQPVRESSGFAYSIWIKVIDQNNSPVKGAIVKLLSEKEETDKFGVANFIVGLPGKYQVEVELQGKSITEEIEVKPATETEIKVGNLAVQNFELRVERKNFLPYQIAFIFLIALLLFTLVALAYHKIRRKFFSNPNQTRI